MGYFVDPTIVLTTDPHCKLMEEEIFGPVLTIYVYQDEEWAQTLDLVDNTSPYGLTGSIYCRDRCVLHRLKQVNTGLHRLTQVCDLY